MKQNQPLAGGGRPVRREGKKTGAVVTAAGMSSRMSEFKPLLKIGSISIVRRIISTLQQAGADPVVLVTGNQADALERHVAHMGVVCLRNENYRKSQMFDSAKIGLSYLQNQCGKILFTPVDVPLFTCRTVRDLLRTDAAVASPVCNGVEGHPLLIASEAVPKLLSYRGERGLAGAVEHSGLEKKLVEVGDEGVLFDMDTREDYERLLQRHNRQMFRPQLRLCLAREDVFFGPGTALLLRLIQTTGSVRSACAQMDLSYSKAWKMIRAMEEQLRCPVVERHQGGEGGGKARLTGQGEQLLALYDSFEEESKAEVQKIFHRHFPDGFGG
ncbi:NTP transferase domain-containing protein [Caproicibacter sp.]|uniref:NTP transferase domain-containing protein n=1 Tax=Caproicibacter sp. TaxID=2814884 RepID=UPI003988FEA1